ncbi:aminotransferase [Cokeromyces recurvatus]|uniref:aminotransferase n=1 Tax=Cokeromyces recurvatus TaxID=90255 RepID=UPI00221F9C9D|nr:aminotransferase [Cokeromyces recurvatus]KAI7906914.1 aminotransferase [Cokeromyces recurvatus]
MLKPTTLIIEQVNVNENDEEKIQYDIQLGNKTFNEFILSYPSGAYTGMRTVHRDAIVELNTHMKRMTKALANIKFEGNTVEETHEASESLASLRDPIQFENKLIPLLRKGLKTFYKQVDPTSNSEHPLEAKVSLMATYSFQTHKAYFAAHFVSLPSLPPQMRIKVEIEQRMRNSPEIKNSQWVRDRQESERNKAKDVNEVVLIDDKGHIYEGMASNFLAVIDKAVYCASLDHILLGSILKIVIDVCEKNQIPIKWDFPKLQDAKEGKWEGCFLTSTSRLLLPIETIYFQHESIEFKEPSSLIEFLRKEVAKEIYNNAYKIL